MLGWLQVGINAQEGAHGDANGGTLLLVSNAERAMPEAVEITDVRKMRAEVTTTLLDDVCRHVGCC